MEPKPWNHPDNFAKVRAFRTRWSANEYRKLQGWTARYAKVRMFHRPDHEWANSRGNVFALRLDETLAGWNYIFEHGCILPASHHGLLKDC